MLAIAYKVFKADKSSIVVLNKVLSFKDKF